jgi:hypothetical protein
MVEARAFYVRHGVDAIRPGGNRPGRIRLHPVAPDAVSTWRPGRSIRFEQSSVFFCFLYIY